MTEKSKPINWTPIIVTGASVGGIALILYLIQRGEAGDREMAERIMDDWQLEWAEVQPFVENMYASGRQPTDGETNVLSSMLEQMQLKEYSIYELSRSTWSELGSLIWDLAAGWGIIVGTAVAGYGATKLVKKWTDKNKPPPNFPCPACDFVGTTKGALEWHIKNEHTINTDNLQVAQQTYLSTAMWTQSAVAVETNLFQQIYQGWNRLPQATQVIIVVGLVIVAVALIVGTAGTAALGYAAAAMVLA